VSVLARWPEGGGSEASRNGRVGASGNELLKVFATHKPLIVSAANGRTKVRDPKIQGAQRRASVLSQPLVTREFRFPYLILVFKPLYVGCSDNRTFQPPSLRFKAAGRPPT
jgi:hypothetical protein